MRQDHVTQRAGVGGRGGTRHLREQVISELDLGWQGLRGRDGIPGRGRSKYTGRLGIRPPEGGLIKGKREGALESDRPRFKSQLCHLLAV